MDIQYLDLECDFEVIDLEQFEAELEIDEAAAARAEASFMAWFTDMRSRSGATEMAA